MKYLKLFASHSNYDAVKDNLDKPNVSHCVSDNHVHYNPRTWAEKYLTFVAKENGIFTFTPQHNNVISYSTDGGETWTTGNSVTVSNGDKVMWKGTMISSDQQPNSGVGIFSSTGNFDIQGNIMSLLFGDNYKGKINLTGRPDAFNGLFKNNTKVINAKNLSLPAITLIKYCYMSMFEGCTSLTTAPELPATALESGCYGEIFRGCTSLITAPELPATTLADNCYGGMFEDCTNLTTAPKLLPATTVAYQCYSGMFSGCTSLVTAPELPATTLAENCYSGMFTNCTSLTTAPELPATTLAKACYHAIFYGCTSLTTAPELPATTLAEYCYYYMFQNCTNLVTAPELLATTLVKACYYGMFYNCSKLTTAPELPATTLAAGCYQQMFYGCTNLNYIKAMFTTAPSGSSPNYYTYNWVYGVASSGTFVKNATATWTTTGVHGIPTGWTVETASE